MTYGPKAYLRISFRVLGTRRRRQAWALCPSPRPDAKFIGVCLVDREGERLNEVVVFTRDELNQDSEPARMNLHYAQLETVGVEA